MGGSHSTASSTSTVKQVINNTSDITAIKESVNKNIMNTITNNSSTCSAAAQANQKMKTVVGNISGVHGGQFGGGTQTQQVSLNLSCVDVVKDQNDMANNVANAFTNQLSTKFDNAAMNKLQNNASAQASAGTLAIGGGSGSNTSTNQNLDLNVSNNVNQTMKDIITNETQRNFNTNTLATKIASLQAAQAMDTEVGNVSDSSDIQVGGGSQTQAASLVMSAVSEDSTINKTVDAITNALNNISTTGVTTEATSDLSSSATSESHTAGLNDLASSIFGGIFGGIAGVFGSMQNFLIIAVIGVVIVLAIFFFTGGQETLQQGIKAAADAKGGNLSYNKSDIELVKAFKSIDMKYLTNK